MSYNRDSLNSRVAFMILVVAAVGVPTCLCGGLIYLGCQNWDWIYRIISGG